MGMLINKLNKKLAIITAVLILLLVVTTTALGLGGYFGGGAGSEVLSTTTSTEGLVGYWNFEEGTGQTANDASDSNNDGTLGANSSVGTDDPRWTTGPSTGSGQANGGALDFDGSDDYVDAGNGTSLQISGDEVTLSAWVYPTADGQSSGSRIVSKGAAAANAYELAFRNNGITELNTLRFHLSGTYSLISSNNGLTLNTWNFVTGRYDGVTAKLYVNGVEIKSEAHTGNIANTTGNLTIGAPSATSHTDRRFTGKIDDLRIYNYARSAAEIKVDYNAGLGTHFQ